MRLYIPQCTPLCCRCTVSAMGNATPVEEMEGVQLHSLIAEPFSIIALLSFASVFFVHSAMVTDL